MILYFPSCWPLKSNELEYSGDLGGCRGRHAEDSETTLTTEPRRTQRKHRDGLAKTRTWSPRRGAVFATNFANLLERPPGVSCITAGMPPDARINALTWRIIKCAMAVHSALGPGLLESAYHHCLLLELRAAGLSVRSAVKVPLSY